MSKHDSAEHEQKSKEVEAHAPHEDHSKGPHDLHEINPKISSDMAYWAHEFNVTTQVLHEAIRVHGTKVDKVRASLHTH